MAQQKKTQARKSPQKEPQAESAQTEEAQEEKPKTCFVICPIGDEGSPERERSDEVLNLIIAPAIKLCGYGPPERSDAVPVPGNITRQMIRRVTEADLVIADLTTHNPNVFYELAIRHAIREPVITIMERGETIPFDVAQERVILFNRSLTSADKCKQSIVDQIQSIESEGFNAESPVSNVLDVKAPRRNDAEEGEIDATEAMVMDLLESSEEMRSSISTLSDRIRVLSDRIPSQISDTAPVFRAGDTAPTFRSDSTLDPEEAVVPDLITWDEYCKAIDDLAVELSFDPTVGGYRPQLIIAICRGGAIMGDLLSRALNNTPLITLWADRHYDPRKVVFAPPENPYNTQDIASLVKKKNIRRILLADDFCKTGASLADALKFIEDGLKELPSDIRKNVRIKTAVLAKEAKFDAEREVRLDYCIYNDKEWLPYGRG